MTVLVLSKFQPSFLVTNSAQMQEIKFWGRKLANIRDFFFWKFFGHISSWVLEGFSILFFGEILQLGEFSFQKKKKKKKTCENFVIFRDFFRHFRNKNNYL